MGKLWVRYLVNRWAQSSEGS